MAAIARPKLRENGGRPMSRKLKPAAPTVAAGKVPAPVKVRLKRVNCNEAIPFEERRWLRSLVQAFAKTGTGR